MQKVFKPKLSEIHLSLFAKLTTVIIGAIAFAFAISEPRMIFWFVLFAWSGLASAFTPVVLCSLFWKRTTLAGAVSGMIAGFLTAVLWVIVFKDRFYDLYEMIPGFAVGFAVTVGVSLLTEPPEGASAEFEAVHAAVKVGPQ